MNMIYSKMHIICFNNLRIVCLPNEQSDPHETTNFNWVHLFTPMSLKRKRKSSLPAGRTRTGLPRASAGRELAGEVEAS
jgi:hypothetical protein